MDLGILVESEMKYKCVWCGAISEPHAERLEGEDVLETLARRLGPRGCSAPDGDGHLWHKIDEDNNLRRGE